MHDVVAYIRTVRPDASPMERHKLAYYAQAWHAAWEGRPLYPERIEAWTHGPVCREVWTAENYGPPPLVRPLDEFARQVVDSILAFYGQHTAAQLRGLSHNEGPWIAARRGLPDTAKSNEEISVNDMRRYYSRKAALGEKAPVRPVAHKDVSMEEALRCARIEMARWREALDELGRR